MSIKTIREGKHVRVSTMAKALKVSPQAVYRYEQGLRRFPPEKLPILARLCDVGIEEAYKAAYGDGKEGV